MFKKSRKIAFAAVDKAIVAAFEKVALGLKSYPVSEDDLLISEAIMGDAAVCGFLPMSNSAVRRQAAGALIDVTMEHWSQARQREDLRHFLFTASFDDGIVFEDAPIVMLAKIRRKVARALRSVGVEAICALEVDVLSKRLAGERARRLIIHVHAICWTDDPHFGPVSAAAKLTRGWAFRNLLGAPAITFVSRAQSAQRWQGYGRKHPDRDQISSSMAWLAYYLLKAPHFAKNRVHREDRTYMLADAGAFRHKTALRMAEVWSCLQPKDVLFGVGEGVAIASQFATLMRAYEHGNRAGGVSITRRDVRRFWKRYFKQHPQLGFTRTRVDPAPRSRSSLV